MFNLSRFTPKPMQIRKELPADIPAIYALTLAAFSDATRSGQPEADLNDRLRNNGNLLLSLVAELDGIVVGHVAFSPAWIEVAEDDGRPKTEDGGRAQTRLPSSVSGQLPVLALGPIAVRPDMQRHGIGSQLILAGFDLLAAQGHDLIFLLGHTTYYPRFGFRPAKPLGVRWSADQSSDENPSEHFMVKELRANALANLLQGQRGIFHFAKEFDGV